MRRGRNSRESRNSWGRAVRREGTWTGTWDAGGGSGGGLSGGGGGILEGPASVLDDWNGRAADMVRRDRGRGRGRAPGPTHGLGRILCSRHRRLHGLESFECRNAPSW